MSLRLKEEPQREISFNRSRKQLPVKALESILNRIPENVKFGVDGISEHLSKLGCYVSPEKIPRLLHEATEISSLEKISYRPLTFRFSSDVKTKDLPLKAVSVISPEARLERIEKMVELLLVNLGITPPPRAEETK